MGHQAVPHPLETEHWSNQVKDLLCETFLGGHTHYVDSLVGFYLTEPGNEARLGFCRLHIET